MNVLIVTDIPTHPIMAGNQKFIWEYSQLIKSMGHEVFFLHVKRFYRRNKETGKNFRMRERKTQEAWGPYYIGYNETLWSRCLIKLKELIRTKLQNGYMHCDDNYPFGLTGFTCNIVKEKAIGACLVNYFYLSKMYDKLPLEKKGLITHDAYTNYKLRNPEYKPLFFFHLSANQEVKALRRCNYVFAMQDEEAILFKYLAPQSIILKSYCNYKAAPLPLTGNHNLLFFSGTWVPNIIGIEWFVNEVFPLIKKVFPDCHLKIAGGICKKIQHLENVEGIEKLGYVDKVENFYVLGDVCINPTYAGAGLKIKTFEAISYGRVVMAHPHCTVGIFKKSVAPIFASSNPKDWVEYLKYIWENPEQIKIIQQKDIEYLNDMNSFIKTQYEEFLK